MPATTSTRWVTVTEAAVRLRLTYAHVRNLLFTGRLKSEQIGGRYGRWMVDARDLARYERQRAAR
ncbi:MAG: helix-turn-helix domain-containing protein [Gemmatimonadales bacterium]